MNFLPAIIESGEKALTKAANKELSKGVTNILTNAIGNELIGYATKPKVAESALRKILVDGATSSAYKVPVTKDGVIVSNLINPEKFEETSLQDIFDSLGDNALGLSNKDLRSKVIDTITSSKTPLSYKKELLNRSPIATRVWRSDSTLGGVLNDGLTTELPRSQAITIGANLPSLHSMFGNDIDNGYRNSAITAMNLKNQINFADSDLLSNGIRVGAGDSYTPYGEGTTAKSWEEYSKRFPTKKVTNQDMLNRYWGSINENIEEPERFGDMSRFINEKPFDEYVSRIGNDSIASVTRFPNDVEMADSHDMVDRFYQDILGKASGENGRDFLDQIIVGADDIIPDGSYKFNKDLSIRKKGGNFGHKGVPGKVGGSAPKTSELGELLPKDEPMLSRYTPEDISMAREYIPDNDMGLSPQQKDFFKDSVVRDENGNLIPMYHGSNSEFSVFDKSKGGGSNSLASVGFWFTPSKTGAKNFANSIWYGDNKPTVYETYLNMKNPKVYEPLANDDAINAVESSLDNVRYSIEKIKDTYSYEMVEPNRILAYLKKGTNPEEIKNYLVEQGFANESKASKYVSDIVELRDLMSQEKELESQWNELKYSDPYEQYRTDIYKQVGGNAELANTGGIGADMQSYLGVDSKEAVKKYVDSLKSQGYDGIIIKGTRYDSDTMGGTNDQYVVFDSNQIKNVKNTNPTSDPDINMSRIRKYIPDNQGSLFDYTPEPKSTLQKLTIDETPIPTTNLKGGKVMEMNEKLKNVFGKTQFEYLTGKKKPTVEDMLALFPEDKYPTTNKQIKHIQSLDSQYFSDREKTNRYKRILDYAMPAQIAKRELGVEWSDLSPEDKNRIMSLVTMGPETMSIQGDDRLGNLDKELSNDLGIGRSNTIMIGNIHGKKTASGAYWNGSKTIGLKKDLNEQKAKSTLAHERLHAMQHSTAQDYAPEVSMAMQMLDRDLKDAFAYNDISYYESIGMSLRDRRYYNRHIEQQARMFQQYLRDKFNNENGYLNHNPFRFETKQDYEFDPEKINPIFDKFVKKLQEMSKKGIALPALGILFGGAAMAGGNNENQEK